MIYIQESCDKQTFNPAHRLLVFLIKCLVIFSHQWQHCFAYNVLYLSFFVLDISILAISLPAISYLTFLLLDILTPVALLAFTCHFLYLTNQATHVCTGVMFLQVASDVTFLFSFAGSWGFDNSEEHSNNDRCCLKHHQREEKAHQQRRRWEVEFAESLVSLFFQILYIICIIVGVFCTVVSTPKLAENLKGY